MLRILASGRLPDGDTALPLDLFALVDRDTWTDAEVSSMCHAQPGLFVTPGWCLENVCLEEETWSAVLRSELPPEDAEAAAESIRQELAGALTAWVRAGAFWTVVLRRRDARNAQFDPLLDRLDRGRPPPDLDLGSASAVSSLLGQLGPDEALDPQRLADEIVAEGGRRLRADLTAQRRAIHGKSAFSALLVPSLERHLHRRPLDDWRRSLFGTAAAARHPPLDEILALLLR